MSASEESASKIEQRMVIICPLMLDHLSPIEIYRRLKNVNGDSVFNIQHVCKWYCEFKADHMSIVRKRPPGRPVTISTVELQNIIDALIQGD